MKVKQLGNWQREAYSHPVVGPDDDDQGFFHLPTLSHSASSGPRTGLRFWHLQKHPSVHIVNN